ncbi:helix-turn-helix domain-containing protein [Candidatus Bathyarchaeota archaeon]|nr:helix-turn-helix domain-containing protein [Candidatus Bathyarchaeota archaeon]MCK5631407.1 helix-turn-helix domain-containing protein [Candidatus Bathyarchaeota archaeon]
MERTRILDRVESTFRNAGFEHSDRCCLQPCCFDLAARRDEQLIFTKAYHSISSVSEKDAKGLLNLSKALRGFPLFICENSRSKPLEDDTVYSRYGVYAVTLETFQNMMLHNVEPLVEAGPGGYYVRLDGEAIKRKRLEKEFSMGRMAEVTGVSRRTLYGYEKGLAKASVATAYKLEWVLGIPIVKPVNIHGTCLLATAGRIICENRFLQFVLRKLKQLNFAVFPMRRTPFDFVAKCPDGNLTILVVIHHGRMRDLEARTEDVVNISKVIGAQPILITNEEGLEGRVPILYQRDLAEISDPQQLFSYINT